MTDRRTLREWIAHAATPWEWHASSVVVWSLLIGAGSVVALVRTVVEPRNALGLAVWLLVLGWPWTRSVLRWRHERLARGLHA